MTDQEYVAKGQIEWNRLWSGPVPAAPEGAEDFNSKILAHMINSRASLGLCRQDITNASRKWSLPSLAEFARRCFPRVSEASLTQAVQIIWDSLGGIDYQRKKSGLTSFYREGVSPPETIKSALVARLGDKIIYDDKHGATHSCLVTNSSPEGWIGISDKDVVATGTHDQIVEIVIMDWN